MFLNCYRRLVQWPTLGVGAFTNDVAKRGSGFGLFLTSGYNVRGKAGPVAKRSNLLNHGQGDPS